MSTDCVDAPAAAAAAVPSSAVLYVDDEEQALKYFNKAFGKSFDVLTATGVDEALKVLEAHHARIAIVLTDHRMPGKTGVDLLARVRSSWPQIMRILVTAYADKESAIESVNSGAVYKYLTKPMDLTQMKQVLGEAMAKFVEASDRDAVLTEKGDLFARAIVADRVRTAATMAAGVSHHMRNSLTAVNCFFEEMIEKVGQRRAEGSGDRAGGETDAYLDQLLLLADQERVRLVGMISDVEARGVRPSFRFDQHLDLAELASRAVDAAKSAAATDGRSLNVAVEVGAGTARVAINGAAVVRMLATLIVHAQRYSPKESTVRIVADGVIPYWGTAAARLRILGDGAPWQEADMSALFTPFSIASQSPNDLGLDLLDAFQTALGHEGDIIPHAAAPWGPGFEVCLPLNPTAVRRPSLSSARPGSTPAAAAT